MAVLSLASAGRYLITWLFSNMPGGHSRNHFSERFRFHPKPWVYTQGFQKDTAEKVKLSRSPPINIDEGAVGSSALLKDATFIWKKKKKKQQGNANWILLKTQPCLWVLSTWECDAEQGNALLIMRPWWNLGGRTSVCSRGTLVPVRLVLKHFQQF